MTKSGAEKLVDLYKYGFWVRTKVAPFRAVTWEAPPREDGRRSFHGKNWIEVLPHGSDREPETFHTADVETVGPSEWMDYYPTVESRVCGWGRPRLPDGNMQYCPRLREEGDPFCRYHVTELEEERNLDGEDQPGAGGESVPASE